MAFISRKNCICLQFKYDIIILILTKGHSQTFENNVDQYSMSYLDGVFFGSFVPTSNKLALK